jgi:pimeloyl-ACP methyl ester carboxylesterase
MRKTAVLVHGTFATEAPWTRPNSEMAKAVRESLGEGWVTQHFDWSGKNSYAERELAADELVKLVDSLVTDSKDAKLVIVAHSHGGNIAIRASQKFAHPERVCAIATLGTPVLQVELKKWALPSIYSISFLGWISMFLIVLFKWAHERQGFDVEFAVIATTALLVLLATLILHIQLKKAKVSATTISLVSYRPDTGNVPLLLVRHGWDEANLWLVALLVPQFFERILEKSSAHFIGKSLRRQIIWLVSIPLVFFLATGVPSSVIAYIFLLLAVPFILVIPVVAVIASVLSAHRFGFGGRFSLKHLFINVSLARGLDNNGAQLEKFSGILGALRTARSDTGRFATPHSLGYSDPKAISKVARWLKVMAYPIGSG